MATNFQFIKSASTTTAVTSLDLTDVFSAHYDKYFLSIPNYDATGTGAGSYPDIAFRFLKASDGSADSTANYDYANRLFNLTGSYSDSNNTGQTSFICGATGTTDARNGGITMFIYKPFDSSYTYTSSQTAIYYASGSYPLTYRGISVHKVAQSNSGIQLQLGVDYCTVEMFGVL